MTMNAQFVNDTEFHKAVDLLLTLQYAICEEDEDRADEIREALEYPLSTLGWEANEWLRGLSGDLDMICDQEVFEPNKGTEQDLQNLIFRAWRNLENDPETLLRLLRKEQNSVSPDLVAYGRARCYGLLGFSELFALFMKQAVRLDPNELTYKIFMLQSLRISGDISSSFNQASRLAREIIEDPNATVEMILMSSGMLLRKARLLHDEEARPVYGWLRRSIEAVFKQSEANAIKQQDAVFGQFVLGQLNEDLNRSYAAKTHYSRVILLAPTEDVGYIARGRLLYKTDTEAALPDFQAAVKLNTRDPLPYLVLARDALVKGKYPECQSLSRTVVKIGGPQVQGQAYEFLAISEYYLNGVTDLAEHYFEEARKLFPEDRNIQQNQQIFAAEKNRQSINPQPINTFFNFVSSSITTAKDGDETGLNSRINQIGKTLMPSPPVPALAV